MEMIKRVQYNKIKERFSDKRGMTMTELLVVIAILGILAGVIFISVLQYQRNMALLERDKIAKEIFIAAQNHLTVAKGEGYLDDSAKADSDKTKFGNTETGSDSICYFIANGDIPNNDSSVLGQMLPFGAIDETVRSGGSIIIRYDKLDGKVLDVFYCSRKGSPESFNHTFASGDYTAAKGLAGDGNKDARRTCSAFSEDKKCVVGWYGGANAQNLDTGKLKEPKLEVVNGDKLIVKVKDGDNTGVAGAKLRVIVESTISEKTSGGETSKVKHFIDVDSSFDKDTTGEYSGYYNIILDEVTAPKPSTAKDGAHINERLFDGSLTKAIQDNGFIPGEDLKIKAVAYSNSVLSNIAYSKEVVENSLFASISDEGDMDGVRSKDGVPDTAYISSFRHLINLDKTISNLGANGTVAKINIANAKQTKELDWTQFCGNVNNVRIYGLGADDEADGTAAGYFRPLVNGIGHELKYDGAYYYISNVKVSGAANAGLFGNTAAVSVKNVELIDFNISGTTTAGALAGALSNSTITNVLARNTVGDGATATTHAQTVSAATAGGLVGNMTGGTISYSAADLIVNGSTSAGGLVGTSSATITGCYSGGHTKDGSYLKWIFKDGEIEKGKNEGYHYDVTGATAGGLVGTVSGGKVERSYSTCSVEGTSAAAGGLVGNRSGGSIEKSYSTGLVNTGEAKTGEGIKVRAFVGTGGTNGNGNHYFSIINEHEADDGTMEYMEPVNPDNDGKFPGVSEIDKDASTYDSFVGNDQVNAKPYDDHYNTSLEKIYNKKYVLKPMTKLADTNPDSDEGDLPTKYYVNTHYGDWPAPETFVVNN